MEWLQTACTLAYGYKFAMKPGAPYLQSTRLPDQVRERVLYVHYSVKNRRITLLNSFFIH
jgi:hypothetical protein